MNAPDAAPSSDFSPSGEEHARDSAYPASAVVPAEGAGRVITAPCVPSKNGTGGCSKCGGITAPMPGACEGQSSG